MRFPLQERIGAKVGYPAHFGFLQSQCHARSLSLGETRQVLSDPPFELEAVPRCKSVAVAVVWITLQQPCHGDHSLKDYLASLSLAVDASNSSLTGRIKELAV